MAGARLRDVQIKKANPADKPYKLFDGGGMFLYVMPTGSKVWRRQFRLEGKYQQMSLGAYPEVTLEEARLKHQAQERILHGGRNPMQVRKEEKTSQFMAVKSEAIGHSFAEMETEWFGRRAEM